MPITPQQLQEGEIIDEPTPMYPIYTRDIFHETLLDFRPCGSWIIFERHSINSCTCSYCCGFMRSSFTMEGGSNQSKLLKYLRIKFSSPSNKGRNSWRKLTFKGFKYYYYLKWTLPSPELIAKKIMKIIGE